MVFNKDCAREILLYVKEHCANQDTNCGVTWHEVSFDELCKSDQFSGYGLDVISYAINMLAQYNLIELSGVKFRSYINDSYVNVHINNLTDKGHEFVDNLADIDVWNKVKNAIEKSGLNDCSLNMYYKFIYDEINDRLHK